LRSTKLGSEGSSPEAGAIERAVWPASRGSPTLTRTRASKLLRGAAATLLGLCIALVLAEAVTRLVLRAQDRAHSAWRARDELRGALEWAGAAGVTAHGIDPNLPPPMHHFDHVLSPFLGVEVEGALTEYSVRGEYFERPISEQNFDLLILGGSVSGLLGQDAGPKLRELLQASPALAGREVVIHSQGRGGFKAPQTSILASLLFELGYEPDLVLLVDGFNEMAIGNSNRVEGAHPLYPSVGHWAHLAGGPILDASRIEALTEMLSAKRRSRFLLVLALDAQLYQSAFATLVVDRLLASSSGRYSRAAAKSTELATGGNELRLELRGPLLPQSLEAGLQAIERIWLESSVNLGAMCKARGIPYLHVLQPTLWDPGAKPMTPAEIEAGTARPDWREGIEHGYPRLRAAGAELRRRGVAFYDASQLFASTTESIYTDCCHYVPAGSERLAEFCVERALPLIAAREAQATAR